MNEPGFEVGFLSDCRVAVWGLGLMGGSLAMALKGKCAGLVGIDSDPETVELAREWGIVDFASTNPADILPGADLIVLATPVRVILSLLGEIAETCPGSPVVMDLGSTKAQITQAMGILPARFDPVGGHPMCGKEKSSLRHADAAVYKKAPFALVALERSSLKAKRLAEELVLSVEAVPLWINAAEHDRMVAATSHAPYLVSSALAGATPGKVKPLVGSGFRSTARLAGSSTRMMVDILATNADNIRVAIGLIKHQLEQYDGMLEQGDLNTLAEMLEKSGDQYRFLVENG